MIYSKYPFIIILKYKHIRTGGPVHGIVVNFSNFPPYPPTSIICMGLALLTAPGDAHGRRSNIGIFDLIFIEYGELYITDGDASYHLRENELIILKPDSNPLRTQKR